MKTQDRKVLCGILKRLSYNLLSLEAMKCSDDMAYSYAKIAYYKALSLRKDNILSLLESKRLI